MSLYFSMHLGADTVKNWRLNGTNWLTRMLTITKLSSPNWMLQLMMLKMVMEIFKVFPLFASTR